MMIFFSVTIKAQQITCVGAPQSRLVIGERAQVIADGGSNLRSRPTADANLLNIIPEARIIPVIDGPFCAGGFAWWQVDYTNERGWVAEGTGEFYWLSPYNIQQAQIGSIRLEIQPNLVTGIQIERLANPPRSQFILDGYPVESQQIVPFIVIFDESPADIAIPNSNEIAQLRELETGTRFIDVYFSEQPTSETDITLIYHYMAITEDGRFIDAYLPITTPNLPLPYAIPENDLESYNEEYFANTSDLLNTLTEEDFTPTLTDLDGIMRSIQVDAPLDESEVISFSTSGIQLAYNPILATSISEALIETDTMARHIELTLNNYPSGTGIIRIFLTDALTGNDISSLQQILSRQPNNPPRIPVLSQENPPLTREALQFMRFGSGEGIRYLASFSAGETSYSYQGLSDDGQYFISALLSVVDDFPPISVLDSMMHNLQVGE